ETPTRYALARVVRSCTHVAVSDLCAFHTSQMPYPPRSALVLAECCNHAGLDEPPKPHENSACPRTSPVNVAPERFAFSFNAACRPVTCAIEWVCEAAAFPSSAACKPVISAIVGQRVAYAGLFATYAHSTFPKPTSGSTSSITTSGLPTVMFGMKP